MKSGFKALLLGSVACGMFAATANAEGFYIGADAGMSFPFTTKVKEGNDKVKVKFDDGFVGDVALGYDFGNNIRGEFDFGYRNFDIDKIAGTKIKGSLDSYAFMGNVYYDFNNKTKLTPFVGAGAGLAYNKLDKKNNISGSSTKPALQAMVGLAYNFTESWSASIAYRYFTTFSQEAKYAGFEGKYNFETQEVLLGIRYTFDAPKAKSYASAAPVAGMPEYMVFFALNSSTITPEAKKTLEKVAAEYKETGEVKLKLTGHTDLTGPAAFNMTLSKERAKSAKAALVAMGVPANAIATFGVGEEDPLVPTAMGVPEPQNRRVVMEFVD
ncbi:MAG: OmpA family protein [Alphaproteobacteria bacterium]|nr:OmpA family protein [Alphaproteobacteria bacterium]